VFSLLFLIQFSFSFYIKRSSNVDLIKSSNFPKLDHDTMNNQTFINKDINNITDVNDQVTNMEYFKNSVKDFLSIDKYNDVLFRDTDENGNLNYFGNLINYLLKEKLIFRNNQIMKKNYEAYKITNMEKCTNYLCGINGICITETKCKCSSDFINFQKKNSNDYCNYKLSYQLYALLFELIFPFGIGHFYCNRLLIGFIKFSVLFLIPLIFYLIYNNRFNKKNEDIHISKINGSTSKTLTFFNIEKMLRSFIFISYFLVFVIWYLFDLVIFLANKHKDGSGLDLIPI
jgi:hypothetical protein